MLISRLAKWPGKLSIVTCSVAGLTGDPHFKIVKNIYSVAMMVLIVTRQSPNCIAR